MILMLFSEFLILLIILRVLLLIPLLLILEIICRFLIRNPLVLLMVTFHVFVLIDNGYTLDDRFARVWVRWLKFGFTHWHTNSIKLESPSGLEVNVIFKLVDGHPTTSMSQVLESFDFGLLGTGYDLEDSSYHDLRGYLFPDFDLDGPLPLMPNKRNNWRNGFISQYNGLRECGRYAKYHGYGYDLSLVKDDLVTGYWAAASYLEDRGDEQKVKLAQIYQTIAVKIEQDMIDELAEASKEILYLDSLDQIMESLE